MADKIALIDGIEVKIDNEPNLLELIRKAKIDLPTFCYHSEISVAGACRMCMVEVEGQGIVPSCSTRVFDGMKVKTNTKQLRDMRKMIVELMLASHDQSCTTCPKSGTCKLQRIAKQMGIVKVRFKQRTEFPEPDMSSCSIYRDSAKCVLCGDCVRVCKEIQSVGVLDFANRGADAKVAPYFNKGIGEVECVNCGQCIKVCPVGALIPRYQTNEVWNALLDTDKHVVVQIAPAVRVAIGEYFGFKPGELTTGQMVAALRRLGFDKVYDTSFAADFTVIEEGKEFLDRFAKGEKLPQFTSCCPAWVKYAEQYYPDLLGNLSSCKSPQQMFGSLSKELLSKDLGMPRENIIVVSIMPCTAKKFESQRPEHSVDGNPDVDFVLTTQELSVMIKERGIKFSELDPEEFDMPFGFKSGAGVIFGSSGGVSEAVLRFAAASLVKGVKLEFTQLRALQGVKTTEVKLGDLKLRLAVVSGLANAKRLIEKVRKGEEHYDLIEVMACCGGCVNGGGQPVSEKKSAVTDRAMGLYKTDSQLEYHSSEENPYLQKIYADELTEELAHKLFHTKYKNRRRITSDELALSSKHDEAPISISICLGSSCFARGAQELYSQLAQYVRDKGIESNINFTAAFCTEQCSKGPAVKINDKYLYHCTFEKAVEEIEKILSKVSA
jgi:NADH-quinone oxidoreductase subunit G